MSIDGHRIGQTCFTFTFTDPLTVGVVEAPQTTSQPVSSSFFFSVMSSNILCHFATMCSLRASKQQTTSKTVICYTNLAFVLFFCEPLFMEVVPIFFFFLDELRVWPFSIPLPLGQLRSVFKGWPWVCCTSMCPNNGTAASAWRF